MDKIQVEVTTVVSGYGSVTFDTTLQVRHALLPWALPGCCRAVCWLAAAVLRACVVSEPSSVFGLCAN